MPFSLVSVNLGGVEKICLGVRQDEIPLFDSDGQVIIAVKLFPLTLKLKGGKREQLES